jgi:hypothetical protein
MEQRSLYKVGVKYFKKPNHGNMLQRIIKIDEPRVRQYHALLRLRRLAHRLELQ